MGKKKKGAKHSVITVVEKYDEKWMIVQDSIGEIMEQQEGVSKLQAVRIIRGEIEEGIYGIELTKKEKRFVLRRLEEMENEEIDKQDEEGEKKEDNKSKETEVNSLRQQKEQEKGEVSRIWTQISQIVKRESAKGNRSEPEYWIAVRESFVAKSAQKHSTMSEEIRQQVMKLLDDEIYYQEVRYYTYGFMFLRELPEVALGSTPRRGFYDTKSVLRYDTELRRKIELLSRDEYTAIQKLLNSDTDDVTKRILVARAEMIRKEKEKRAREGRDI